MAGGGIGRAAARVAAAALLASVIGSGAAAGAGADGSIVPSARDSHACNDLDKGTRANERLIGTSARDRMSAGRGDDRVSGRDAADCLIGGPGRDRVKGGPGGDVIAGGPGPDAINARDGSADVVRCGGGRDEVRFDPGLDTLRGCERDAGPVTEGQCAVDVATLTAPGCARIVNSDTSAEPDAERLWGSLDCEAGTRHVAVGSDGDPHPTATGAPQPDDAFRRLTVLDGDDYYGERCELGRNDHRGGEGGGEGTFALYREGARRITFASIRFPGSFPLAADGWQTVMQMKQAQPYDDDGGRGVALELQAREGALYVSSFWNDVWSIPVEPGAWVRVALDVRYSQDAGAGTVSAYVDANGDGDAADAGEASPVLGTPTLAREVGSGQSIPSHLRAGIYHDPSIDCPNGCGVEIDNVQVVAAS